MIDSTQHHCVIRYWGSHFKSARQVAHWLGLFAPLRTRGWRCCLVLERLPEERAWISQLEGAGIELACITRPQGQFDWNCIRAVCALCARLRADVFHCENIHTSPMVGAWLARVPARVWQKHSMFVHFEEGRAPTLKERLALSTRLTCLLTTKVVAVSKAVADELVGFGVSANKVLVRPNPRTAMPGAHPIDRTAARRTLGLAESDVVVATIGHAVPVKGWDVLLKSFVPVARAVPTAKLVLAGSHTASAERGFYEKLSDFCAAEKITERVLFTGHVADIAPVLRAADVFVSPSRSEGFSHALIEALEEGVPCVATRVGIAPEVIREGVNGFLVERGDATGLARALTELVAQPQRRAEFARHVAVPACIPTLEEYAEQLWSDYEAMLGATAAEAAAVRQAA